MECRRQPLWDWLLRVDCSQHREINPARLVIFAQKGSRSRKSKSWKHSLHW